MYKKTNQYASEFETFASKVETMVNEYITADKNCAKKIRSNGKSHRQKTGLPKGLGAALISSTFEKLGDIIEDVAEDLKTWADNVIESIKDKVIEDWDSFVQFIESSIQVFVSGGIVALCIAAGVTGIAFPVALPIAIAASISLFLGVDKFTSSVFDIFNWYETDGSTFSKLTAEELGIKGFGIVYDILDTITSVMTGTGATNLSHYTNFVDTLCFFRNIGRTKEGLLFLNLLEKSGKISNVTTIIDDLKSLGENIINKDLNEFLNGIIDDGFNDGVENIITSDKFQKFITSDGVTNFITSKI